MATSISYVMAGVHSCQSKCLYCSAGDTMKYEQFKKNPDMTPCHEFKFNKEKVIERLDNHRNIKWEKERAAKENRKPAIHIDIWGAEPLYHVDAFKETCDFLKDYFKDWDLGLHTSSNGLSFISDDITNYVIENNIHVQLSHDGLGQWIRTGDFDPCKPGSKNYDNLKKLFQLGIIDWVNCTLSAYNTSFFGNIEYWNRVRQDMEIWNKPLYIKLNHIYDSTYDIKAINKHGYKNGKVDPELIGKPLGDLALHGRDLWDYMTEFVALYYMLKQPYYSKGPYYQPYVGYILEQGTRFDMMPDHDTKTGACRAFQRWRHKIGDPKGWDDQTFVIDSLGEYSECNLIDSTFDTLNPGGVQKEHCKGCKFEFTKECNPCGSEPFADECEYLYAWNNILPMISVIDRKTNEAVKKMQCHKN